MPHPVTVEAEIRRWDDCGGVGPVLEQTLVLLKELIDQLEIELPQPAPEYQQVTADDDAGRVELEIPDLFDQAHDVRFSGPTPGCFARETLAFQGQLPGSLEGNLDRPSSTGWETVSHFVHPRPGPSLGLRGRRTDSDREVRIPKTRRVEPRSPSISTPTVPPPFFRARTDRGPRFYPSEVGPKHLVHGGWRSCARWFGMVARRSSPIRSIPQPDGSPEPRSHSGRRLETEFGSHAIRHL